MGFLQVVREVGSGSPKFILSQLHFPKAEESFSPALSEMSSEGLCSPDESSSTLGQPARGTQPSPRPWRREVVPPGRDVK